MGKLSRAKGRTGQSMFSNMLRDRDYNVVDTTAGKVTEDCLAIDPGGIIWSVEIKKTAMITPAHLKQAMAQARDRKARWMLANHIEGTSSWLVRRQGMSPVVWHQKVLDIEE